MNLTGKQLVEKGIITGEIPAENVAQHGIDLNLIKVEKMEGIGFIPKEGKTKLVTYIEMLPTDGVIKEEETLKDMRVWHLNPGSYSVTFSQGCKIPADKMLLIRQRSSLLRNGTFLHSSVFDAGFETEQIGTVIVVVHPIQIEVGARIAQIYAHNSDVVENLYDGQFQKDSQRK
jgi:deoxycytidine triphosphate deaminase